MDVVDQVTRSRMMSSIRGKNTQPELRVRRFLHAHGYRFRLHRKDLPGNPDIVLPKLMTCIFVHGCFWHRHPGCRYSTFPSTHTEFWGEKFRKNVERDVRQQAELKAMGWTVLIVWECELKAEGEILSNLLSRLDVIGEKCPRSLTKAQLDPSI
ncbi:very short patch repair endonuclease [Pseudomonas vancouverensis]|uniref:Very short patch repair endonuclease n=1 Tax=Pseudomonas vancouverensis TaxID=95300 RepID=A0A1H2MBD9_PSEVA|nr:very short patch repair endonuclease [Pseudomonas vancouverensis]KAB0498960.1 DNA mismatch endonuclease Vsr [Pseudomonas vancouverensis]TDB57656.1 DNA mismatch endonuclease Vsr [Pseudomonas vancouverensis]SDU89786.1 T/G mismatch-specific endonuclease [Pseudomonas vancouverensis]